MTTRDFMEKQFKIVPLFLSIAALGGCVNSQPEYMPGFYQPEQYHEARFEPAYYDYYGRYHAAYERDAYYETGRWHRAPIVSEDNLDTAYYVETALKEEVAMSSLGEVVTEGSQIEPVIE